MNEMFYDSVWIILPECCVGQAHKCANVIVWRTIILLLKYD